MPETIRPSCSNPTSPAKWHWHQIPRDLEAQGGLRNVTIDPLSVTRHACAGQTENGTQFNLTWVPEMFLLLSVTQDETELVDAFAAVVGYKPFCRYTSRESGLLTYEWDKTDPEGRFAALQQAGETNLERLNEEPASA